MIVTFGHGYLAVNRTRLVDDNGFLVVLRGDDLTIIVENYRRHRHAMT